MKRKLFLLLCALLTSVGMWAADYLTNFGDYTVTKTAVSNDNTSGTAREFWRGGIIGFDVNGTSTTIPNGVYSFSVQAVYRGHLTKDIPTGIIAYAESDGAQYMAPICNITDGTVTNVNLNGFATAFQTEGNYLNTIPYIIVTDGKIKVGVKSMSTQPFCDNGMWFIFNTASFKVSDVTDAGVLATALSDTKAQAAGLLASNSDETTERSNLQSAYDAATATTADIVNLKQKIDAYLAKLVEIAEQENPLDVSYYFTNPKYSIRNLDLVGGLVTSGNSGSLGQPFGWTCFDAGGSVDNGSGNKFQEGQGYNWFSTIGNTTIIDDHIANYDVEKTGGYSIYQRIAWNQWAEQTHSAKQTATLPAGAYKISVPAYASANNDDYKGYVIFTINGTDDSRTVTANSWNVYEKEFLLTEPAEVSVDMQFNKLRRAQNVASAWAFFDGITLLSYGDPVAALKKELEDLQASIDDSYLNNSTYTNVIGTERTNLISAKTITAVEETVDAYQDAIDDVQDAIDAFTTAKTNYDALVVEIAKAKALGIDDSTADGYAATSSSTAATALTSTQNLMVAEYNYATENYATPIDLGVWTETGTNTTPATFSNEHWSGTTREYKNQNDTNGQGYNASSWSMSLNQDITLPAGDYVFKVAGRKSADATMTLTVTNKSTSEGLGTVADFPSGNNTKGINTSGETDFTGDDFANGGSGFGWQWRYVPFSLEEETTVNIAVSAGSSLIHNWASFGDYAVWSKPNVAASTIAYNKAVEDAGTAKTTYPQVTGTELTELNEALDADKGSTVETIDAATTAIKTKTSALIAAAPSYAAYLLAKGYGEAINSTLLPYASTAKLTAVTTALSASVANAEQAVTATDNINTANRAAYESNMNAEGVAGAKNRTSLIINADANSTDGWSDAFGRMSNEPYTEADGTSTNTYFDKNGIKSFTSSQTIKLVAGTYILSVTARAQNGIDSYKLKVTNNADETEEVALTAMGNANGVFNRGWNVATVEFTQKAFGDATISIEADNTTSDANFWMSWDRFRLVSIADEDRYSATIGSTGWTTFSSAYPLDLSDLTASEGDVKAYYASASDESKVTMTSTTATVAAGEGLMLKGNAGATVTIPVADSGSSIDGNMLVGCPNGKTLSANENHYVLINNNGTAEFQSLKTNGATMPAGKAYLNVTSSGARLAIAFEDDATGINAIEVTDAEADALKDGKYLENGKIVIVKNGVKYSANGQILK